MIETRTGIPLIYALSRFLSARHRVSLASVLPYLPYLARHADNLPLFTDFSSFRSPPSLPPSECLTPRWAATKGDAASDEQRFELGHEEGKEGDWELAGRPTFHSDNLHG